MKQIIALLALLLASISVSPGESVKSGDNSIVVNDVNGNISITYLNLQEELLRKEIEKVVEEIRSRGDQKTKQLVDELQELRKRLSEVVEEKNRLTKIIYAYSLNP